MYLDIDFNETFSYVLNSFRMRNAENQTVSGAVRVTSDEREVPPVITPVLTIAGDVDGNTGFTLPSGVSHITFQLRAPDLIGLVDELDDLEEFVRKETLVINHAFSSEIEEPCNLETITRMNGYTEISYGVPITHIKTNRHKTLRIRKR
jgi:hypothetical protein